MIHIVTNHHETLRWLKLQSYFLAKNTPPEHEYRVYCGVTDIDAKRQEGLEEVLDSGLPTLANHTFFKLENVINNHGTKLDELSKIVIEQGDWSPDDLLIFIDPDAFPIENTWLHFLMEALRGKSLLKDFPGGCPLIAISREENPEPLLKDELKPYPHPCFCATTVGYWKEKKLSWKIDPSRRIETAGVILKELVEEEDNWGRLLRTNCYNLHPLNFGVYGHFIYHHGSGNRPTYDSADIWSRPQLAEKYGVSLDLHFPNLPIFNDRLSNLVYEAIHKDENFIHMYFSGKERGTHVNYEVGT